MPLHAWLSANFTHSWTVTVSSLPPTQGKTQAQWNTLNNKSICFSGEVITRILSQEASCLCQEASLTLLTNQLCIFDVMVCLSI
uniref:Uncharacterized protein n=1 Tax=Anguilla anguilla TaxID=7936 RepID=A0A0E9QQ86_ANGAN